MMQMRMALDRKKNVQGLTAPGRLDAQGPTGPGRWYHCGPDGPWVLACGLCAGMRTLRA